MKIEYSGDGLKLDDWCHAVLKTFEPKKRQQTYRRIALALRKQNQKRMTAQKAPDGIAWQKRAVNNNNNGIAKKKKMMLKLRKVKHFKVLSKPDVAYIGWDDWTAESAAEHHQGLTTARGIALPARPLLGVTKTDTALVYDLILAALPN